MFALDLLGAAAFAAWVFLLLAWGRFWTADMRLARLPARADPARSPAGPLKLDLLRAPQPARARPPKEAEAVSAKWPEVVGVIPARDEADSIGQVVEAHLGGRYPGLFSLVLVDDASSDGTAEIAKAAAEGLPRRLSVIAGEALPPGWTGKLWAQAQGLAAARRLAPEAKYVLLCDADIVFGKATLTRLVAQAEAEGAALVSLMARLDARGFWASILIPAFILFFQKLYPFAWSNDPKRRTAAAAGGVMLARAEALQALNLPASIQGALIDDCALAAKIKRSGRKTWIGLAAPGEAVSLRDNRGFGSIWSMVARTAYAQLGNNPWLLWGCLFGLAFLYLAGPALLLTLPWHGSVAAASFGAAAWGLMTLAFLPTAYDYGRPWAAPLLPLAGLLYGLMTFDSARRSWQGRGGAWKGRTYPAKAG